MRGVVGQPGAGGRQGRRRDRRPPEQFGSPNALACYAGKAPVTRRSGKSELVVACRLACNRYLAGGVQQWAFCSLSESGWARPFYDAQLGRGKTHHAALRALGNRWLEILWHCLMRGELYDEAPTSPTATAPRARPPDPMVDKGRLTERSQHAALTAVHSHSSGRSMRGHSGHSGHSGHGCPTPADGQHACFAWWVTVPLPVWLTTALPRLGGITCRTTTLPGPPATCTQ